jgi:hypothetical protein
MLQRREHELIERRVAAVGAVYTTRVRMPDGRVAEVQHNANRGDLIRLTGAECARLDEQGALAPEGWTAEQVEGAVQARIADYQRGRRELEPEEGAAF